MPIAWNEINSGSNGGTEQMARWLETTFGDRLDPFFIVPSRLRGDLPEDKYRIFWCHDLPGDQESDHLKDGGWARYHKIVCVSHWQKEAYINNFKIPHSHIVVIQNAIEPIVEIDKSDETIRLIYHTTPHRGLILLYEVYNHLYKQWGDKIHLDVFSSFEIYGWGDRDKRDHGELFEKLNDHPGITNHGTQPNDVVREYLTKAHIFAYPSVWPETSCISLMEAMSAACLCVHSDYAALPETASNWTYMYPVHEQHQAHAEIFLNCLGSAIEAFSDPEKLKGWHAKLLGQKSYADLFYSRQLRQIQWEQFLEALKQMPLKRPDEQEPHFVYRT